MRITRSLLRISACLLLPASLISLVQAGEFKQEVPLENNLLTHVEIQLGAANINLSSHSGTPLAIIEIQMEGDETPDPQILLSIKDGVPTLHMSNEEDSGGGLSIVKGRHGKIVEESWTISLSQDLPLMLDIEFGLGSGVVDFGGMHLEGSTFATGLSDVELDFSAPLQGEVQTLDLATGLGSMEVRNLMNARIKNLEFAGGLGAATLDFSGSYRFDCNLDLNIGMGSLELWVPEDMGVKVRHSDSFLSTHEFARLEQISDDTWYSSNWRDLPGNLDIELSVGMGSVTLEWIEPK
jgi:hypothetical protein